MKKALLSVVAAGLVATAVAPAALANNDLTKGTKGTFGNTEAPVSFGELQKDRLVQEGNQSEAKTKEAAKKSGKAGDKVVVDKGAAKAKAPVAKKALPKTSAAK